MPDFVYVLVKYDNYSDSVINLYAYLSAEKACEMCDYLNKEEDTTDYEVEQIRMIK